MQVNSEIYAWVLLPILIFLARVMDVSMGTVRVIMISRGHKLWAPIIGFFEILIWLLAIGQIMQNLNNPMTYLAFAGGFATGNFIGLKIAEKLSLGVVMIRVVTDKPAEGLLESLRAAEYGVTSVDAQGARGPVKVLFTILPRKLANKAIDLVKKFDRQAFYTVEEVGFVAEGARMVKKDFMQSFFDFLKPERKGK